MYLESRLPILLDLGFRQESVPQLKQYLDLLRHSNEELNLVSRKMSFEELVDNHVIDCCLPLSKFPKDVAVVADFGSGGGLPGVLYAIQFPQIGFHLFEKSPKKREFLERCRTVAPNLQIEGEIAGLKKDRQQFDLVTSRAFKPVDVILEMSREYFQSGGRYFLLKGRREKINEEIALAQKKLKEIDIRIEPLQSPVLEVERHLVLIN